MKKVSLYLALILYCSSIFANEYVFVGPKFSVDRGDIIEMHLFITNGFNVEAEQPMQTSMTKEFKLVTNEGMIDLKENTKDHSLPIINQVANFDGLGLFSLERHYEKIIMRTDDFKEQLKDEYIENIQLSEEEQAKDVQIERYNRYVKALVRSSGDIKEDTLYRMIVGDMLEIVLLQNPYVLTKGDVLDAKILYNGEPLKNKMISAHNRLGNLYALVYESRTNEEGVCSFKLEREGVWFIDASHIIANPVKDDSEWESFWASYSFAIK